MGEGAEFEALFGVVAHREAVQRETLIGEEAGQGGRVMRGEMVGVVQVRRRKAAHATGGGQHLGHRVALALEGVQTRGVARAVRDHAWAFSGLKRSGRSRSSGSR